MRDDRGHGTGMRDSVRWPLVVLVLLVLVVLVEWAKRLDLIEVVKVYDGDTIELKDGTKVRLIGVDAPEVESPYTHAEPGGDQSRDSVKAMLLGQRVRVVQGPQPFDKYGRSLGYVYLGDVLVNGRIIRDGWARAYRRYDYRERELFIAYEKEAQARRLGLWGASTRSARPGG